MGPVQTIKPGSVCFEMVFLKRILTYLIQFILIKSMQGDRALSKKHLKLFTVYISKLPKGEKLIKRDFVIHVAKISCSK